MMPDERRNEAPSSGTTDGLPTSGSDSIGAESSDFVSTVQKIESLFDLLRLPPDLASIAECVPEVPASIGRYPVIKLLGSGGFGRVVLAYDERLDRNVAIKIAHRSDGSLLADAQRAVQLQHDGIVTIHAVETLSDGTVFVVMEHLAGGTLAERLGREGKLSSEQAVQLILPIARAVQHAHQKGFVHRDLKPDNILFDDNDAPHVVDFGLAVHERHLADRAGEVSGTSQYMAPEQIRGEVPRMDGRTDIWALGVILYEMLTGQRPFSADHPTEVREKILFADPRPPRQIEPAISTSLQEIVLKCLNKQPVDRYASVADLVDALHVSLDDPRARSRRYLLTIFYGLVALGLGVTGFVAMVPWRRIASRATSNRDVDRDSSPDPLAPLDARLDLRVWRPDSDTIRGLPIQQAGVVPLRVGDQYRIEVELTRPAFVYLLAIDTELMPHLVYPWIPEQGQSRPQNERKVQRISSPAGSVTQGWPVTPGRPGICTMLLLARDTPLPPDVDLLPVLTLGESELLPLNELQIAVFVQDGKFVNLENSDANNTRSSSFAKAQTVNDPLLAFHERLVARLRPHFSMIRAVSYPDAGK